MTLKLIHIHTIDNICIFDKYNKYHRIQVALIHKYFLLSNCPSSDDVTNKRKVYRTIVMIDFVLEIINTPHWGLSGSLI